MSDRRDGGAIAGILTGALLGVTVAMLLAPARPASRLRDRGRALLDAASPDALPPISRA